MIIPQASHLLILYRIADTSYRIPDTEYLTPNIELGV